jgi:hypothetical protein
VRYRLGEFRPTPDLVGLVLRAHGGVQGREGSPARVFLSHVVRLLSQADHSPEGALDELLQSGLPASGSLPGGAPRRLLVDLGRERENLRELPDLLACDELEAEDRTWVGEIHDSLAESRELRAGLRLLECARVDGPDGYVALAATNHDVRGEVRRGDAIYAGFAALRPAGGELTIRPRVHRVLCTNGQIVYDATHEDALEREGSVRDAITHCLSGAVVEKAARRLRAATHTPAEEPTRLLPEIEDEETRARIRTEWESSEDQSLFAAINAVTAVARAEEHFGRRLALESAAGRLLERAASSLAGALVDATEEPRRVGV